MSAVEAADRVGCPVSDAIFSQRTALAELLVERQLAQHPDLAARYGSIGRERCLQDAGYHLSYLAEALAIDSPELFTDYLSWAKVLLARRQIPATDLLNYFHALDGVLRESLPQNIIQPALELLHYGLAKFPDLPANLPPLIDPLQPHSFLAHRFLQALLRGKRHLARDLILNAVRRGVTVREIYLEVFQRSQYEIGRLWQTNEIGVAEEHYCTAATQLIMAQLYPQIFSGERKGPRFVGTCVEGDLHEIGMRMVADFFEMAGWNTYFLGANTPNAGVLQTVLARRADVLGISATIAYHVRAVDSLIRRVRAEPACARLKILVGGYPFNRVPELWRTVGADGSARDGDHAVAVAEELTGGSGHGKNSD